MVSTPAVLWQRRGLIRALTLSNLRRIHGRTVLGCLWWLLDPLMMMAVYTIVIEFLRGGRRLHEPYPVFLLCGLVAWKAFATPVIQSITTLADNEGLVKSYAFPKAVLPLSLVLSNQILFAVALVPLLLMCFVYGHLLGAPSIRLSASLAYVPLIWAAHVSITLGLTLLLACLGVFLRDLATVMRHVMRVLWYLSPSLYALTDVMHGYDGLLTTDWSSPRCIYVLNPFAHVMEGYRKAILYGSPPDPWGLALALAVGVAVAWAGLRIFRGQERKFAKLV